MATIKINDAEIYYELHGHGEPLILIAGYTCDHLFWGAMLEELKRYFQVLIFDNRGVGQTKDSNQPLTLEIIADDTIALAQKLGLARPHILGQSMGGAIAQTIAYKYPDKINKLMILNSVAKFNTRTLKAIESLLHLRKENISFESLVEASLPWFFSSEFLDKPENITTFKEALVNNPFPQSVQDQERQFRALQKFDSRSWLHKIKMPTQIIAAEGDIVCLVSESQYLAESISGANFIIVPGSHSSPVEKPNEVCKIIQSFSVV